MMAGGKELIDLERELTALGAGPRGASALSPGPQPH